MKELKENEHWPKIVVIQKLTMQASRISRKQGVFESTQTFLT